jgi:hypothetical protein
MARSAVGKSTGQRADMSFVPPALYWEGQERYESDPVVHFAVRRRCRMMPDESNPFHLFQRTVW